MTRERFVDSGGVRIHVVEEGPADGPPVLFLHGFPEFWWSWRHQISAVAAAGFRAVAMDMRGFGDSDVPSTVADYSIGQSLQDVAAVAATLGGRVTLVTHDWGGAVGWVTAALMPDTVERLVAMNAPHPNAFRAARTNLEQLQRSWYMFFFQFEGVAEDALSANGCELLRTWFYDTARVPLTDDELARYVESFSRPGRLTAGLNWYRANVPPQGFMQTDGLVLPPIACPTMVLWGLDDAYLTFEIGRRAGEFCTGPFALHALPDTGHWIQQERPDEVNRLLLDFLGTA